MDHHVSTIKPRRIQNQNVIHRLEHRRISSGKAGTHWHQVRVFHQNVFPNFTVVNVEKPPCFLRKFSPDGRYFIAFSSDQTSLDLSLFSYDDKWVSVMERPKTCGDHPIRFYARDSGLLKFEIQAGLLGRPINHTVRRLVAFTFHPFEPFAISVQRTNAEYVVNFHMRHCCT
uniref:DET1 partner of COP1 E3 ubiquitin ligase n=1 Tax=Rousettus aegyptiacus TaxID=9407 RepID=A0A7J8CIW8_ROUAE|nr:hypothetical protein HJG63_009171 [Rousettus aegyptiacus]